MKPRIIDWDRAGRELRALDPDRFAVALVDSATDYERLRPPREFERQLGRIIADQISAWERTFTEPLNREIFRLRGVRFDSRRRPRYLLWIGCVEPVDGAAMAADEQEVTGPVADDGVDLGVMLDEGPVDPEIARAAMHAVEAEADPIRNFCSWGGATYGCCTFTNNGGCCVTCWPVSNYCEMSCAW